MGTARNPFQLGDVIHGFCGGVFGRDSYNCRRVEAVGSDWIVTRNDRGEVEMTTDLEDAVRYGNDCMQCEHH